MSKYIQDSYCFKTLLKNKFEKDFDDCKSSSDHCGKVLLTFFILCIHPNEDLNSSDVRTQPD